MTWKQKGLALFLLVAVVSLSVWAEDESPTWIETFEGPDYGAFFDVVLADDGTLVAAGTTHHALGATTLGDVLIAKVTLEGGLVWEKTHGGDAMDQAICIEATSDGGFLVLAETDSFGAGQRDFYLLRLDAGGGLIWSTTYGGAGIEWAKDLLPTSDGGFLLVGESDSFGGGFNAYVVKVDAGGDVLWETTLGDSHNETGVAALEAENGDLLVLVGVSYPGGYEGTHRDTKLFRLDRNGREIWQRLYRGDVKQWGNDMAFTPEGDVVVVVGATEAISANESPLDFWIAKIDAETGKLIWSKTEGSHYQDDYGVSVVAIPEGGYLVAGFGPAFPVLRFTDDGQVDWVRDAVPWRRWTNYGGFSIIDLGDGTFAMPGWIFVRRADDDFDAVIARIDSEGTIGE